MKLNSKLVVLCGVSLMVAACGEATSKDGNGSGMGSYSFGNPDKTPSNNSSGIGGDGGGSTVDTSVDTSKTFDSLSDQDRNQLCEDAAGVFEVAGRTETICTVGGYFSGTFGGDPEEFQANCEAEFTRCMAQVEVFECDLPTNCNATVQDAVDCFEDTFAVYDSLNPPSCAETTAAEAKAFLEPLDEVEPASCIQLDEACQDDADDDPIADNNDF